jgi:hypothetical protein
MTKFPPSETAAFETLHKLDHCFASLLSGEDIDSHEPLPGFENGLRSGMTRTDMVRCKSTAQNARILIVDVMSRPRDAVVQEVDETDESGTDGPGGLGQGGWDEEEERIYMDVARVYENTLVKLGETLGDSGVVDVQMSAD